MLYHTRVYDALGRLETIASHNGKNAPHFAAFSSTTYQSNALDQRVQAKGLDKNTWIYGYNHRGEVVSAVQKNPSGAPLGGRSLGYTFDGIGNRTSAQFGGNEAGQNQRTLGYTPNALNQYSSLTNTPSLFVTGTAQPSDSVTVNDELASRQEAYFWKELTAPVSASAQSIAVSVSSSDVTHSGTYTFPPQSFTPSYDLDGNLLADGLFTYTWNEENQLIRKDSVLPNQPSISNSYDARGRCISQTETLNVQSTTTLYLYDGWNVIAEFTTSVRGTGSKILTKTMTWGSDLSGTLQGAGGVGGLLWCRFYNTPNLGATNQICCHDGNGNVSSLVDTLNMKVTARYEYGPFGELMRSTGEMAELNEYRFSTKRPDKLTGLYYYGYRWYDPRTGRWLSRDPIGDMNRNWNPELLPEGPSLYAFVGSDPINSIDPWGLSKLSGTVWMRCLRCKNGGAMTCWFEMPDGRIGNPFPTNSQGGNNTSKTLGDPYGSMGPVPPGDYDVKPKADGPKNNEKADGGGTNYRKGTPSITQPGRRAGSIVTPKGTRRGGLRIHKTGGSDGCITCEPGDNSTPDQNSSIENLMNSYEKMKLSIKEVCCSENGVPKAEKP